MASKSKPFARAMRLASVSRNSNTKPLLARQKESADKQLDEMKEHYRQQLDEFYSQQKQQMDQQSSLIREQINSASEEILKKRADELPGQQQATTVVYTHALAGERSKCAKP